MLVVMVGMLGQTSARTGNDKEVSKNDETETDSRKSCLKHSEPFGIETLENGVNQIPRYTR